MEHANCLQCGEPIAAEDAGLCARCTREVHGTEPTESRCRDCGASIAHIAGVQPGVTFRLCPNCQPDELDALMSDELEPPPARGVPAIGATFEQVCENFFAANPPPRRRSKLRTFTCLGAKRGHCGHVHRKFVAALECIGRDLRATTRAGEVISDRMPVPTDGSALSAAERAELTRWESTPW